MPSAPRIGRFLVQLERLEQAQPSGVFLVDRIDAVPDGVVLRLAGGGLVILAADSSTKTIASALRTQFEDLQVPEDDIEFPLSAEPDVQTQWAQLHYALGAYEDSLLEYAHLRVLAVERTGSRATVQLSRGPEASLETYSLDLDREIDIGLADTIAFAPDTGRVNGSLNGI